MDNKYDVHSCTSKSKNPVALVISSRQFASVYSFQEMAKYDIPAMLEHALNVSGQAQLFYIGHSQGTLVGFTGFSANPELAKKVKLFIALAPIFYLTHTAKIMRDLAFTLNPIEVRTVTIDACRQHALGTSGFSGRIGRRPLVIVSALSKQ